MKPNPFFSVTRCESENVGRCLQKLCFPKEVKNKGTREVLREKYTCGIGAPKNNVRKCTRHEQRVRNSIRKTDLGHEDEKWAKTTGHDRVE
jgi:hypothetical protein